MNPFGVDWWPVILQPFVDAVPLAVLASLVLGVAAVITRYRRGDRIVRLQIRWFVTAVALLPLSGLAILIEVALRSAGGAGADAPNALITVLVSYAVVLALPIAIGIAVTRYRLYEIDRLISRTIGWALVTGVLVAVFGGTVVGLQAILDRVMQGQTLAVAASTLIAFALFQPVRRRVQTARRPSVRPRALRRRPNGRGVRGAPSGAGRPRRARSRHRRGRRIGRSDPRRSASGSAGPATGARHDAPGRRGRRLAAHRVDECRCGSGRSCREGSWSRCSRAGAGGTAALTPG